MMNPDELHAEAQALRVRADGLERQAQHAQRVAQLRHQAQALSDQADELESSIAPSAGAPETSIGSAINPASSTSANPAASTPALSPASTSVATWDGSKFTFDGALPSSTEGNKNAA